MNTSAFRIESDFHGFRVCALHLLLPAASQSAVQLHDRESFVFLGDSQIELGRVVVGVVGKHFKVAGRTAVVAKSDRKSVV